MIIFCRRTHLRALRNLCFRALSALVPISPSCALLCFAWWMLEACATFARAPKTCAPVLQAHSAHRRHAACSMDLEIHLSLPRKPTSTRFTSFQIANCLGMDPLGSIVLAARATCLAVHGHSFYLSLSTRYGYGVTERLDMSFHE